jgi:2-polyprenyl-3-methyl-5-hydroxy-6-metoxy-1,4-benzoquinol methylase
MTGMTPDDWPADGLTRVEACPACGGTDRARLHEGVRDRLFSAPGNWTVWRCGDCGSAFLDPRPSDATLGLAYADYMTHEPPAEAAGDGPLAQARRRLVNGYLNRRYGYRLTPASALGWPLLSLIPPDPAHRDKWIRHLRWPGGEPSLLDVGCANGAFMLQARSLGWEVHGIDFDEASVAQAVAAGLDARVATVDDLDPADARFDAITVGHVIEHLPDPGAALERMRSLLRPNGMIWLATPNVSSLGHRHFGRHWFALDPPRHLVLFTPAALAGLLRSCGFEDIEILRPTPDARYTFAWSQAIAEGAHPFEARTRRSLSLRLRERVAERASRRNPVHAEDLIVAARAGSA